MKRAGLVSASFIFSFVIVTYGSACDQPTSPHGSVITHPTRREKYQNGQVILFGCKQGFYLDGMPIITCNGNKWTQTQFRCLGFCPEVGNILNGKVSHVTPQVGKAAIEFRCANKSFQLIGKTRLECIDGQWNGKLPYCQKLPSCVRLQSPANGTLHGNDNSHGAEANFTCFTGFDLFGASALTCNKGVWSSQVPTCKANCTKIMNLPNGHVFGTRFSHGQVVSFNCKYGYELVGDRSLRCINGRWNSSVPQCKVVTMGTSFNISGKTRVSAYKVMPCVKPSIPSNSRIIYPRTDQVRYTHGTTLYLACHEGHLLTGSPIMECNYTTWLKREFKCIAKSCGRPQIPLHGNIKSHVFTFRSKVYFECNPGFKLVGDKYRQCQANQTWSGRAPTCKPIDCGRLSTPHKVLIVSETGHTRFGGYVKYRCKEKSYELIGSETRVCQNDEQWSGVEPSCQIINCGNPDTPANVKQVSITNGFNYGSSVEFACEANYTLEGSKIITCGETKEWSSSAPSCLAPCLDPGEPGNGIRIGDDFTHGKFIKFQCDGDFEHVGEKTIQCLDGKWSHKIPQCKVISCGDPGTPTHGRQTNVVKNFAFRGIVEFQCDKGYTLNGKSSLSCQRNKTWDGDVPKCLASCSYPDSPLHGINRRNIYCSIGKRMTSLEIMLPKENTITAASIQLGQDKGNVQQIQIKALLSNKWVNFGKPFKPHFNEGVEALKFPQPVITRFVQVLLFTRRRISSCLTPTLYGCDAVHRGCIMPGSAVLFKEGGTYRKGRFASVWGVKWEVVEGKRYKYLSKDDILILDEKPNVNQLSEGTTVVGTDSRGKIKEGNIKRSCSSTHCPIETNGEEWQSKLENVRLFKGELCK